MDGMILKYYEDSCIKTCNSNISWICIRNLNASKALNWWKCLHNWNVYNNISVCGECFSKSLVGRYSLCSVVQVRV